MVGIGLASLLLVAALVVEGRSVLFFHTITPWSSPDRMHVCDRTYNRGGIVSAQSDEVVTLLPLEQLAWGPLWQPVYGHQEHAGSGAPCGTVVYLREGDGYRTYELSGGP